MAPPPSTTKSSKTTIAYATDPSKITMGDKIMGALSILMFVSTWISSLLSPFLLLRALYKGQYVWANIIIGITLVAYAPGDQKGPMAQEFHKFVWYYFPRYFQSLTVEYEGGIPPKKNSDDTSTPASNQQQQQPQQQTFYAIHPHGAFSFGWATLFCHPDLEQVRFCFAPALYASPFFRLFSRSTGTPGSASKSEMIRYMKLGNDIALPPGGFEEATLTSPNHDRVFIKKRIGFVKLCLQHGLAIRPVYCFGEKALYWNLQGGFDFRINVLNKNGLPAIVTWGHPLIPLLPRSNVDMKIVVGAPMVMPKIEDPTNEVVKQWHDKYMAALTKLFEDHKESYYGPEIAKTTKLELW